MPRRRTPDSGAPDVTELADAVRQTPNDGVVGLAAALLKGDDSLSRSIAQVLTDPDAASEGDNADLIANALANTPNVPKLQLFAGYLGGVIDQKETNPTGTDWRLLYLDPKLLTWLLVDVKAVLLAKNVANEASAFGAYDYVWMNSDATVSQGEGAVQANELQARYMRGDFVSAGNFAATVTGGTYSPPTGPVCPLTPGCCGIKTK